MKTFLCISSYYKGVDFMVSAKSLGNRVLLVTSASLKEADWPWEAIDEIYFMEEKEPYKWNMGHLVKGVAYLLRSQQIDSVVALDDYDVEKAAHLREAFRISGMGETTYRYFRDKLAMREKARLEGVPIPEFSSIFNDETVNEFTSKNAAPWVLKPRSEASASGIVKAHTAPELWEHIHRVGEERHLYLVEQFRPGDVYHVDALVYENQVVFALASRYLDTPMNVAQGGGVFQTATLDSEEEEIQKLLALNEKLLIQFGMQYGATHTEFIKDRETGEFVFLETASRVGGAFIPDMVEAATGINLWHEWAKIENAILNKEKYTLPQYTPKYGGLLVSLSKVEYPNYDFVTEQEFVKSLPKKYHIGMLFAADNSERIQELLDKYSQYVAQHFLNVIPPKDYPTA